MRVAELRLPAPPAASPRAGPAASAGDRPACPAVARPWDAPDATSQGGGSTPGGHVTASST
jgi:hypothetical protein